MNVSFTNINFSAKTKAGTKQILMNCSGQIERGRLVALMGASGAGKSSLLNILSRRVLNHTGAVEYDGKEIGSEMASKAACFIQQEDLFFGKLSVKEHLEYQASLRLPKQTSKKEREQVVQDTIASLGLTKAKDSRIGNVLMGQGRGVSGGEQKRLNVATELLTSPEIIFADEPTTGLDSFIAQSVVQAFQSLAATGRTIVCTVHQPSSRIFEMFDDVLLMAEGQILYFGPRDGAPGYFGQLGFPCPEFTNPADHLIRIISVTDENRDEQLKKINEWVSNWQENGPTFLTNWEISLKASYEETKIRGSLKILRASSRIEEDENILRERIQRINERQSFHRDSSIVVSEKKPTKTTFSPIEDRIGWFQQLRVLLSRCTLCNRRDPILVMARAAQTIIQSLLMGFVFFRLGNDVYDTRSKLGASFMFLLNQGMLSAIGVTQTFPEDKPIVQREYESGIVHPMVYFYAKMLADSFVQIIFPSIFHAITWWMCGMNDSWSRFLISWGIMLLSANALMALGYLASAVSPSTDVALTIAQVIQLPLLQFSGFMVKLDDIPVWLRWVQYLSPYKYGYADYTVTVFYDVEVEVGQGTLVKGQDFLSEFLGIDYQTFYAYIGALVGFLIGLRLLASFALLLNMRRYKEYS